MSERDKFLDGKIGKWNNGYFTNFSTWEGFGVLWEWAQEQEWWNDFKHSRCFEEGSWPHFINPDRFADAIYEFLKDRHD